MPVKRRASKRRLSPEAELEAWRCLFETGCDFFGDAAELTGLLEPVHVRFDDQRAEAERRWREAAQDAWHRLGAAFLANWTEEGEPWAVREFGTP
jgi:hypothetical protein